MTNKEPNDLKILAIIPARKGSKRIIGKNLIKFIDKPLISHTIEAAIKTKFNMDVMVFSDSEKINELANNYGQLTPLKRPKDLSGDQVSSASVVNYILEEFKIRNVHYDIVVLLQPTSPLRRASDIDNALNILISQQAKSVISAFQAPYAPESLFQMDDYFVLQKTNTVLKEVRSQDLPRYYKMNGAIYACWVSSFNLNSTFYPDPCKIYLMPYERSIDIDTMSDLELATFFHEKSSSHG